MTGYRDLSIYGSPDIQTPRIDQLMKRVRFTKFTANSCVCSPSRAAFLTGNLDLVGVPGVVRTPDSGNGAFLIQTPTIADVFKKNGYRTSLIASGIGLKSPNTPNERL